MNLDYWFRRILGKATCILEEGSVLQRTARVRNILGDSQRIRVGKRTVVAGELLVFSHGGEISVGEWCYIGKGTRIWSAASIRIGDRVLISHNVNIFDSLTHPLGSRQRHAHFREILESGHPPSIDLGERPVMLGNDAWIGANACVLRGVSIGEGAIIGAGSVVTCDIPSFTIAAGNPASVIRELRADER